MVCALLVPLKLSIHWGERRICGARVYRVTRPIRLMRSATMDNVLTFT